MKTPDEMTDEEFHAELFRQGIRFGETQPRRPLTKRQLRKAMSFVVDVKHPKDPQQVAEEKIAKGTIMALFGVAAIALAAATEGTSLTAYGVRFVLALAGTLLFTHGVQKWIVWTILLYKILEHKQEEESSL